VFLEVATVTQRKKEKKKAVASVSFLVTKTVAIKNR
jgi:hypothetical protein